MKADIDPLAGNAAAPSRPEADWHSAPVCPVHGTVMQRRWVTYVSHGNIRSVSGALCIIDNCTLWHDFSARGGYFRTNERGERIRFSDKTSQGQERTPRSTT